jgi:glycosyltransferase involved in cell wall biosynthesis
MDVSGAKLAGMPLVVFSHLRWTWVWQRPQHLISRLAAPGQTWFVEEPLVAAAPVPGLQVEQAGGITRVWMEGPGPGAPPGYIMFGDPGSEGYKELLLHHFVGVERPLVWLYTPMALDFARALNPALLVYDVMDDLASFKGAPEVMRLRQRQALAEADLVFAGGRSLYKSVVRHNPERTFLFPSGVEPEHYAGARRLRASRRRPVAGYVGVIDERLDLDLVSNLASQLPEWDIQMVGPLAKIDEASLPQAPNLAYLGVRTYKQLPAVMGGFDVALMPFALNEATRSISPTKTLEYLAAGLPVVSTRVPDVVADFAGVVDFRDGAYGFAAGCRAVLEHSVRERDGKLAPLLSRHRWDSIAAQMAGLIRRSLSAREAESEESA